MTTLQNTFDPASSAVARRPPRSARTVLGLLEKISQGRLDLRLPDDTHLCCGDGGAALALEIGDWSVFDRILERGDVGFAEAWIDGQWTTPDLPALLTLLAQNREALTRAVYGQWWGLLSARLRHPSTPTREPDHDATSWRITTWEMISTRAGSTRR